MKYEQKNCPFCQSTKIKKHGTSNNIQRYFCNERYKTFSFKKKLDPIKIWVDYTSRKQTYQELTIKYHCSVRTIQRYIAKAPKNVRTAYTSLTRYMDYIFTYAKYPELNIERTTNRLEGLFGELKRKINNHNGLNERYNILFIQNF